MGMSKLRKWRKTRQLAQFEVARMLGTSIANVCRIELGQQWPSAELMERIERVTKRQVTASDILETCMEARENGERSL